MEKSVLVSLSCFVCIILVGSCSSTETSDFKAFSTELDVAFVADSGKFSIKPPLDWKVQVKNDDVVFKPDIAELDARNAKAKIVIQYIKLNEILTPEQFRDVIEYDLKSSKNVDAYEIVEYGGTPANAYCNVLVEYDSSIGESTHYFKNIFVGSGYFRIAGSSLKKYWKIAEPLLNASIDTFKIID